jgi:hypothetical protein
MTRVLLCCTFHITKRYINVVGAILEHISSKHFNNCELYMLKPRANAYISSTPNIILLKAPNNLTLYFPYIHAGYHS